ncbi:amidase [Malassezia vespertilionis]|uniref:Vacuolar protein-sorting-associated protein 36 n=1 Tax=Malassezia vespertilionis TaxID=2020962 RepID=A0A2N1J868_9BASI|nr:amidase [Malassezia vespertilionis]PKI82757.1 hypothetical protein MVES_003159 [Malassezia vespertilionis]WFD08215.1 amidase [Malassezia vespertilionis]
MAAAFVPWCVPGAALGALLARDETLVASQAGVGMYDGDQKVPSMNDGTLVLTTHRLVYVDARLPRTNSVFVRLAWIKQTEHYAGFLRSSPKITLLVRVQAAARRAEWTCAVCGTVNVPRPDEARCGVCGVVVVEKEQVACRACTYLNDVQRTQCEMCETDLGDAPHTVKFSFRRGGDAPFYAALRDALQTKPWAHEWVRAGGIDGALRADERAAAPSADAFQDLSALMAQAKQLVEVAANMRTQLERRERSLAQDGRASQDEAGSMLQSALVRIGLAAPAVTPDMVRDEEEYHRELALELAQVLLGDARAPGLMGAAEEQGAGVVALDEVWGVWNRLRGIALVSPKVMRAAVAYLPHVARPSIQVRVLGSGLAVLHTARFEDGAFEARLLAYAAALNEDVPVPQYGLTTMSIAERERIPMALCLELLHGIERRGAIARDVCGTQDTRWFSNRIMESV